jgi:hypothetical protein
VAQLDEGFGFQLRGGEGVELEESVTMAAARFEDLDL